MITPRGGPLSSDARYDPPGHTPASLPPPPYISAPMTRSFTRLAWTAATFTYLLIILGAIVRITGSGLGCGEHWPLCNGKLLPLLTGRAIGARSAIHHRAARRALGQPGSGERVPGIPALQRRGHPGGELSATPPLGPPAARPHAVRVRRVVGGEHETAWCVVRG